MHGKKRLQAGCELFHCFLQVERLPLEASGTIPSWLHGDYVRNGPGTFKSMKHLFDGYGMIVKFSIKDGQVTTQQRYLVGTL